jgi:hypothetical protein
MPYIWERELVEPTSSRKIGHQGRNGIAIPQSKLWLKIIPVWKNCRKWRRAWGKEGPVTETKVGSSSSGGLKTWHYYKDYGTLTKRDLSWLPSERANKQVSQMQIIYTQPMDRSWDLCGWIREKLGEAEEEGEPVGGPAFSTNLDLWDNSDTGPPTRPHTPADMRPRTHIQQRTAGFRLSQRRCT